MDRELKIDLTALPDCPLESRIVLTQEHAAFRARLAVDCIKNRYPQRRRFEESQEFIEFDLTDSIRFDFESLDRVWFFPETEAADELSEGLNRMLEAAYKASRDNMRRALEVVLVGAFFRQAHTSAEEAKGWIESAGETPFFSRTVKRLSFAVSTSILIRLHRLRSSLPQAIPCFSLAYPWLRNSRTIRR